jgi:hypothetical protein
MWDGIDRASGSSRRETPAAEDTTVVAATPLSNFFQLMKFNNYLNLKKH